MGNCLHASTPHFHLILLLLVGLLLYRWQSALTRIYFTHDYKHMDIIDVAHCLSLYNAWNVAHAESTKSVTTTLRLCWMFRVCGAIYQGMNVNVDNLVYLMAQHLKVYMGLKFQTFFKCWRAGIDDSSLNMSHRCHVRCDCSNGTVNGHFLLNSKSHPTGTHGILCFAKQACLLS